MTVFSRVAMLAACLMAMQTGYAVQDCTLNGESVNPNNGGTTAGKTGLMRCQDRDSGQTVREQELKAGKFMGVMRYYDNGKLQKDYSQNERGNRQGRYREFSPGGQVLRDENFEDGDHTGLSRMYHDNGQLRRATWYDREGEKAYAEFTQRGQLLSLKCGDKPQLAPAADDARLCGFSGGQSTVEFFGERGALNARSNYLAGKRVKRETFNDNGNPSYQDDRSGNGRLERYFSTAGVKIREVQYEADGSSFSRVRDQEFTDNGTLKRDQRFAGGKPLSEQLFYLNGQPRSKTEYGGEGTAAWKQVSDYFDSGKISQTGRYTATRGRQLPLGTHQGFNEDGKVVAESIYDDKGHITREKAWDNDGKLLRDDAVFEDGSRKAFAR